MERNVTMGSLFLGIVGWLCTLLLAQMRVSKPVGTAPRAVFGFWPALALPVIVWAMTLPAMPPFSSGQGWGRGFLLGGIGALAAALVIFCARANSSLALRAAATAPLFAAIAIVCVPLLWMRHAVIEVLVGAALGWIAVSFALLELQPRGDENSSHDDNARDLLLLNGSAFAASLCAASALGVYRDFVVASVARGTFSAVVVALASSVTLALLCGALMGEVLSRGKTHGDAQSDSSTAFAFSLLLCLALPLGLGYLLALKILDDLTLFYVIGIGTLLGFLLWWLAREDVVRDELDSAELRFANSAPVPPLAIFLALCGFMFAYQIAQGLGAGLMLIAAWPASLLAMSFGSAKVRPNTGVLFGESQAGSSRFHVAQTLALLLSFLAILLLSRLFAMRFRVDLRGTNFTDQYALFGFAAGAVVPAFLASFSRNDKSRVVFLNTQIARLCFVGLLAVAIPGAMLALWGMKIVPAFFVGLALSVAGFHSAQRQSTAALLGLAISLAVAQWAHRLAPLAEVARVQRLHFLVWALAALVFLILLIDYGARLAQWLRGRKNATGVSG